MWRLAKTLSLALLVVVVLWIAYEFFTFPSVSRLDRKNPTSTSIIDHRSSQAIANGKKPKPSMTWKSIEQISTNLQKAVIVGEDSRFFDHNGFDWDSINKAWDEAVKEGEKEAKEEGDYDPNGWIPAMPSFKRGASTITQQLAKNLYLSEDRNFLRKAREAAITVSLERQLSKKRILELYLNIIEWGDEIYGAEAASRRYFGKSASSLTPSQAAYLAAMIPSPLNVFNPKKNPRRLRRRQRILQKRMVQIRLRY